MKSSKLSELTSKVVWALNSPDFPTMSKLERDLLMHQLRDLYEELDGFSAQTNHDPVQNADIKDKKPQVAETTSLGTRRTLLSNDNLLQGDTFKEKITQVHKEVVVARNETKSAAVNGEKVVPVVSINESIQSSESLNEKLKSSSAVREMHKKLASKPLKELIGLNQKFVILNELFKGNSEAFAAAVNHIDSLADFSAADAFIQTQLVSNYYWDESSQSARLFLKLVKQKFGVE